jgi:hypothetical protein
MKVVFLLEFEVCHGMNGEADRAQSDEDLQWYLWKDPAHTDFKVRRKSLDSVHRADNFSLG